jgi:ABC-2 type transport system permease protein
VLGGVARGLLVGILVTLLALFFTEVTVHNVFVTITVVVLTAVLFAIGGFINALFARKFDDIAIVPTFVLTPLTYLGGVFYSIHLLSDFWQGVSMLNPILYMVNTFRYGILGVSDINHWVSLVAICVFIVLFFGFALWLLERGREIRQ